MMTGSREKRVGDRLMTFEPTKTETRNQTPTYELDLPVHLVAQQLENVVKANERAAKAGILSAYSYEVEEYRSEDSPLMRAKVRIFGDLLKKDNFHLVAVVDWSMEKPLVHRIPHSVGPDYPIPAPTTKECVHCQTARNRKDTYLVWNSETDEILQVGSTCLIPYCGISPSWVYEAEVAVVSEASTFHDRKATPFFWVEDVLELSYLWTREHEWVNRIAAERDPSLIPTTEAIRNLLLDDTTEWEKERKRLNSLRSEESKTRVTEILDWIRSDEVDPSTSEYLANLKVIASARGVSLRNVGLAASMVVAYDRELLKKIENSKRGPVPTGSAVNLPVVTIETVRAKEYMTEITYKAWVSTENGSLVYLTIPKKILELKSDPYELVGQKFSLTVDIAPVPDSETRGWGSRPRKVKVIS